MPLLTRASFSSAVGGKNISGACVWGAGLLACLGRPGLCSKSRMRRGSLPEGPPEVSGCSHILLQGIPESCECRTGARLCGQVPAVLKHGRCRPGKLRVRGRARHRSLGLDPGPKRCLLRRLSERLGRRIHGIRPVFCCGGSDGGRDRSQGT